MAEARERERWSTEQWQAWREERLAYVLHRAATQVPYYRDRWQARRARGDRSSWELLENWPILEKDELRKAPRAFVADDCNPARMFEQHTSGSTGKPLTIWHSRETLRALYAIGAVRTWEWSGMARGERWARIGGRMVTPVEQRRPPFWVWNAAQRQLYLSSYHLAPDLIPYYLDAIRDHRVVILDGYASSIHALAKGALELGRRDIRMRAAITNGEPLLEHQREAIAEAFGCAVQETYGMAENVAAASACRAGRLHQWPELGLIEVCAGNEPVPDGIPGDLVCTGLLDADMPLIRYRVGDRGSLPADSSPCECGRTLPMLNQLEGRADDVLYTPDGRAVGRLSPVFKGALAIRGAQVTQEQLDLVRIRVVPAPGYGPADSEALTRALRDHMGDVRVVVETVEAIPLSSNGKLRTVICQVPAAELRGVLAARSARH
jgi:phenylacetate-CoA ligase